MGFSLENIIDDATPYAAPDFVFISTVSGLVRSFPWERYQRFFESRPLIKVSAEDQIFLLRIIAIQEVLCMDDESVLKWLKNQMYLLSFLAPEVKPKIPTKALLNHFRAQLHTANLLEPFRQRCQDVILQEHNRHHNLPELILEDKWVICPKCESSALHKVETGSIKSDLQASCDRCGHHFNL